jgi:hypothetical protein
MEENCIGSQSPQWTVVLEKKNNFQYENSVFLSLFNEAFSTAWLYRFQWYDD